MKQPETTRRRARRAPAIAVSLAAICLVAAGLGAIALAGQSKSDIHKVSRSDAGATSLARSIFEANPGSLVRAKFVTVPPGHDPVATSTKPLAGFPRKGKAFAILSTGCAHIADRPNNSTSSGCQDGGEKVRGARDVTIWRIRVDVPKGSNCLSFRFKFLSEEYKEFVGSEFNDAFIAELAHSPQWSTSGNQSPGISAPGDFATTRDGKDIISINGTGVAKVSQAAAKGTTYDAATAKLRASTPVKPGPQLLYLSLFDQGDRQYDSAVFIDRLLVRHAATCKSGLVKSS